MAEIISSTSSGDLQSEHGSREDESLPEQRHNNDIKFVFEGIPRSPQVDAFQRELNEPLNSEITSYTLEGEDCIIAMPKKAPDRETDDTAYASYGENGATASVDSSGNLIQITQFLGIGQSGFFSVDQEEVPLPCSVHERAKELIEQNESGYGIRFFSYSDKHEFIQKASESPWKREFVHNRWPRFTSTPDPSFEITSQHFVSNETFFHRWEYKTKGEDVKVTSVSDFFIPLGWYRIRELDFINENCPFNSASSKHTNSLGPHGYSVILSNEATRNESNNQASGAIGLVIAICINGQVQELVLRDGWIGSPQIKLKLKDGVKDLCTTKSKPLEITMGFRLQFFPKIIDWKRCLIPRSEFLSMDNAFKATSKSFRSLEFSSEPHLNFILGRNLEHILSVCSIPVPKIMKDLESKESELREENSENERDQSSNNIERIVAFTCGDISGHRLVTSASFFAFQFLLRMLDHLGRLMTDTMARCDKSIENKCYYHAPCACMKSEERICEWEYSRILRNRIRDTCISHLGWVVAVGEKVKMGNDHFAANYWAMGEKIKDESLKDGILSTISLTDTPFQLIKLADFALRYRKEHSPECVECCTKSYTKTLESFILPWLKELDGNNRNKSFTFHRPTNDEEDEYRQYHLNDHVWIWRVLQLAEELSLGRILEREKPKLEKGRKKDIEKSLFQQYSPAEFRRQVLTRFTTENGASMQRMLAVARSPSENSFKFSSKDAVFFYPAKTPFFKKSDILWKSTIEAQRFHTQNQDVLWDNPLQYALALLMGDRGFQINSRSPDEMAKTAKEVLLKCYSGSGIFPGHLHVETKESEVFPNGGRDFYWHTSFETLFLFWQTYGGVFTANESLDVGKSTEQTGKKRLEMKNWIPSNNLIDPKSIVELQDEWMYNLPEFLEDKTSWEKKLKNAEKFGFEVDLQVQNRVIQPDSTCKGIILDIAKKSTSGKRSSEAQILEGVNLLTNIEIFKKLEKPRTARNAKKRLVWLPNSNSITRDICVTTSPLSEWPRLLGFWKRHDNRAKYFSDETVAILNVWRTEFHLSSYQLFEEAGDTLSTDLRFIGGNKRIKRAAMGFIFSGDYFDRFWTCHVLQYEPKDDVSRQVTYGQQSRGKNEPKNEINSRFEGLIKPEELYPGQKRPWFQRKILELFLFDQMLANITGRYEEMLDEVDHRLREIKDEAERRLDLRLELPSFTGKKSVSNAEPRSNMLSASNALFSLPMEYDYYATFSKEWPPFQYTLQIMEEDLKDTLDIVERWKSREKDRQLQRPRWTRDDERKYRSIIDKATNSNDIKIKELERFLASIQSMRVSLTSRLESSRNELSFRSAENVRFFTYVTVVFLPLGFATGVFSMSGAPDPTILKGMVATSIITLLLTSVALANAQFIDEKLFTPIAKLSRSLWKRVLRDWWRDHIIRQHTKGEQAESSNQNQSKHGSSSGGPISQGDQSPEPQTQLDSQFNVPFKSWVSGLLRFRKILDKNRRGMRGETTEEEC